MMVLSFPSAEIDAGIRSARSKPKCSSYCKCAMLLHVVVLLRCLPGHRHARRPRIAEAEPAPRTNVRRLVHSFRRKPKRDLIANVLYVYDMLRYTARNSSTKLCVLERAYKVPGQAQNNPHGSTALTDFLPPPLEVESPTGGRRGGRPVCGHYNN